MKILVEIKTPVGEAANVSRRINGSIVPKRMKLKSWVNDDDSVIYWEIDGSVRDCFKVNRNVTYYHAIMNETFNTGMLKSQTKKLSLADQLTLKNMLIDQTSLRIVKMDEQLHEDEFKFTLWDKIKQKFNII